MWEEEGQVQFGRARCFIRLQLFEVLQTVFANYSGSVFEDARKIQARVRGIQARRRFHIRKNAISIVGQFVAAKRSEEHTSELQSLMRISYAVFCLKKKTENKNKNNEKLQR